MAPEEPHYVSGKSSLPVRIRVTISIVIPVYNEAEAIPFFLKRLQATLKLRRLEDYDFSLIIVDDGSADSTVRLIQEQFTGVSVPNNLKRVSLLHLSRNFGKESALSAGLQRAHGDASIIIDADLQDPPELIPELVALWKEGYEMVVPIRASRDNENPLRRLLSISFYKVFSGLGAIPLRDGAGDFRLLDRRVVHAINSLPENCRFMKGLYSWVGFRTINISYIRETREHGQSQFNISGLFRLAAVGIISFSAAPLYLIFFIGLLLSLLGASFILYIVLSALISGNPVDGYPSLASFILFFGGINCLFIGILGVYISQLFSEVKRRPSYIVSRHVELLEKHG